MDKIVERNGWITITTDDFILMFEKGSDSVQYDAENGRLVISNLPDELVEQIEQALTERKS